MMKKIVSAAFWILSILLFLSFLCFFCFIIYVKVRYWGTPIGEIPYWAWWLMK